MPERHERYLLNVPEDVIGHVMGELSNRGGVIFGVNNNSGIFEVRAEMPDGSMASFESWLAKTALGRGTLRRIDD